MSRRLTEFTHLLEQRLSYICQIIDGKVELPKGCDCSASLADKELERVLEDLQEVYASAELIRSLIWQEQSRDASRTSR